MATNTTKSLKKKEFNDAELQAEVKAAKKALAEDKLVKVSIPKVLEPQIGPTLFLSVNGAQVTLPVDGTEKEIPKVLADHLKVYLNELK
jgi:hypothetical protein